MWVTVAQKKAAGWDAALRTILKFAWETTYQQYIRDLAIGSSKTEAKRSVL